MTKNNERYITMDKEQRSLNMDPQKFLHHCPVWNYLFIDETCYEIAYCNCYEDESLKFIQKGFDMIIKDYIKKVQEKNDRNKK